MEEAEEDLRVSSCVRSRRTLDDASDPSIARQLRKRMRSFTGCPSSSSAMIRVVQRRSMSICATSLPSSRGLFRPDDRNLAFRTATTSELLRGAAVLTVCSQPWLVRRSEPALALAERALGTARTEALLKHTIFAHFVAGEDAEEIKPLLARLNSAGIGGILDYAAESDLESSEKAAANVNQPSRVYPYVNEEVCEANLHTFLKAVEAVHAAAPGTLPCVQPSGWRTAPGSPWRLCARGVRTPTRVESRVLRGLCRRQGYGTRRPAASRARVLCRHRAA